MKESLKVADIMTHNVVVAGINFSFTHASRLFFELSIHHLPVVNKEGVVVGMLSSHDVLKAYSFRAPMLKDLCEETLNTVFSVAELMTPDPITISSDHKVQEALEVFDKYHIHSLPVVDDGRLVGIITSHDLIKCCAVPS